MRTFMAELWTREGPARYFWTEKRAVVFQAALASLYDRHYGRYELLRERKGLLWKVEAWHVRRG